MFPCDCSVAVSLEMRIDRTGRMHMPHNTAHKMLKMLTQPKPEKRRRKWVRCERTHSNSMWHTDYKQLDDGRWFIPYLDDTSRFMTAYGVFGETTTKNALKVLELTITNHGKPAPIMTNCGSQFYANEYDKRGVFWFEKRPVELDVCPILTSVRHPQTNGKLERLHGEIRRKLCHFEDSSYNKIFRGGGPSQDT